MTETISKQKILEWIRNERHASDEETQEVLSELIIRIERGDD